MTALIVTIANDSRGNMEQVITEEKLRSMSNDALQRLANGVWYNRATELCWLVEEEIVRRRQVKRLDDLQETLGVCLLTFGVPGCCLNGWYAGIVGIDI